jgi:hypothetical protein
MFAPAVISVGRRGRGARRGVSVWVLLAAGPVELLRRGVSVWALLAAGPVDHRGPVAPAGRPDLLVLRPCRREHVVGDSARTCSSVQIPAAVAVGSAAGT